MLAKLLQALRPLIELISKPINTPCVLVNRDKIKINNTNLKPLKLLNKRRIGIFLIMRTINKEIKFNDKTTGSNQNKRGQTAIFNSTENKKIKSLLVEFTFKIKHLKE